jgi:hypothetical protein
MIKRVLFIADTHCGHKSGLTPPAWHTAVPEQAPRSVRKAAAQRVKLWRWFAANVDALWPIHRLIHLGDAVDGRGEKSGGVELMTTDREEQARMAAEIIRFVGAPTYMVRGTPYHVGEQEEWENWVAKDVGAKKIEDEGHYDIRGLKVCCKHFIGNSNSTASKYTALSRAQVNQLLWAALGQQDKADIIIRAHIHRYARVEDDMGLAAVCPPLQGLGSRYGVRQRDGLPCSFGFLCLDVESREAWTLRAFRLPLVEQRGEVNVL